MRKVHKVHMLDVLKYICLTNGICAKNLPSLLLPHRIQESLFQ